MQELQLPPSSLQAKVEPASLEAKAKLAVVSVVLMAGPLVIVVSGAVVSGWRRAAPARSSVWVAGAGIGVAGGVGGADRELWVPTASEE